MDVLHSNVFGLTIEEENRLWSIWHSLMECSIFFGCINFCLDRLHLRDLLNTARIAADLHRDRLRSRRPWFGRAQTFFARHSDWSSRPIAIIVRGFSSSWCREWTWMQCTPFLSGYFLACSFFCDKIGESVGVHLGEWSPCLSFCDLKSAALVSPRQSNLQFFTNWGVVWDSPFAAMTGFENWKRYLSRICNL